ncbi:hypothetical protein D3C76_1354020 [compost metagenome]
MYSSCSIGGSVDAMRGNLGSGWGCITSGANAPQLFVSLQRLYVHHFDTDYDACDSAVGPFIAVADVTLCIAQLAEILPWPREAGTLRLCSLPLQAMYWFHLSPTKERSLYVSDSS